jgi:hypothetical protein
MLETTITGEPQLWPVMIAETSERLDSPDDGSYGLPLFSRAPVWLFSPEGDSWVIA